MLLIEVGYTVQVPADVNPPLTGAADEIHFAYARANKLVILTYNPADFHKLHAKFSDHSGILAVYQDNDPSKDMTYADIVQAVANLQQIGVTIAGGFWVLNMFRW
jgi:predicted nuclease of predicted toxin-antitoxin system